MNASFTLNIARLLVGLVLLIAISFTVASADEHVLHSFKRKQLTNKYYSEGAAVGDINGDDQVDLVYGPHWYAGPDFQRGGEIYQPVVQNVNGYSDHFFAWVYDFNQDGNADVFTVGFPGTPAYVYENPGPKKLTQHWNKHQVFDWVSNESPQLIDLLGDKTPELVCTRNGFFGFATIDPKDPLGDWTFHEISEQVTAKKFGHGLGVGDINGDGRTDIIHPGGWYEQPSKNALNGRWKHHAVRLCEGYGGAEMIAYDVDGDGDNDVITSHQAHAFGLGWYEQLPGEAGEPAFRHHLIMGSHPSENRYGLLFSELHSLALADIDGDGLKDIVTGKTYWSHHKQSPLWDAGAVVYWFKLVRNKENVDWVPFQADDDSGIGRQVVVSDVNGDKHPDLILGGMKGGHVLIHEAKQVNQAQWQDAQPKPQKISKPQIVTKGANRQGPKSKVDSKTGRVANSIEGEYLAKKASRGSARAQDMGSFRADKWSNNSQLWWTGARVGDELTLQLPSFAGKAKLEAVLTRAVDYGIVQLAFDGKPLGEPIDLYDPQVVTTGLLELGEIEAKPGKHTLSVKIVGANPKAKKAYMFALDYLRIKLDDGAFVAISQPKPTPRVTDEYPHAGQPAAEAVAAMKLPDGFTVQVGASEPDVKQPIAMAIDDRGRVWIAEAYEYPQRAQGDKGRDRILIFEDTDGDGSLDKRRVFIDGLNLVSGLEVGFGGVWVGAAPYLMFIPDRNGDDIPDREPVILLDGWGYQDTHETLNAFIWGPDGWLYGCHGVFTHSLVGKPGSPKEERTPVNAAVWRYHPIDHAFEVFAHGTSNPWGVDFNDHGQAFITACVIPHLYHVIQGARYQRQGGRHFNPHTYDDIKTIADHLHYLGSTPHSGNNKSDAAGGGHAHAGAMIYLGDQWPAEYRDRLFMNNIHGQRLNVDILKPQGSGYVGGHGPDFLLTGDQASQILNLRYGPDGNAWMIDWYDMQACHRRESSVHDRSNGRIYKICYGASKTSQPPMPLNEMTDLELANLSLHANDWYVRHSRRNLQERSTKRKIDADAVSALRALATDHADPTRRLRAAWALHVIGELDSAMLLTDTNEYVRGWAIQLAMQTDNNDPNDDWLAKLTAMASADESPVVRLYMASAAQRLPLKKRWAILENLVRHREDASDHNLPLMIWYAAEPLAESDPARAMALAMNAGDALPLVRDFLLKRIGAGDAAASLSLLAEGLKECTEPEQQQTFLAAIRSAARGKRSLTPPADWFAISKQIQKGATDEVRLQTLALDLKFGGDEARTSLHETLRDKSKPVNQRLTVLEALLESPDDELVAVLLSLLDAPTKLRQATIVGMAQFDAPKISAELLVRYKHLATADRRLALGVLCSRESSGISVLKAIEAGEIAGVDLTADLVRQLQYLKSDQVNLLLKEVWGTARESDGDKLKLIASYKTLVESTDHSAADPLLGRAVFARTCMKCHMLYGVGRKVGPDLTGSNRANLDYLLANIVDPSAVMAREYRPTIIATTSGRIVTGLIVDENANSLTLQTSDAELVLPKDEIEERDQGVKSMMPDDQLKQFSAHEIRSLVEYLRGKQQTSILADADNAASIFNGSDLSGWNGDPQLWSVEEGEIVGRTDGLKRNHWLVSDLSAADFRLSLDVKLIDNAGNSGIQFRSRQLGDDVAGYQADVGKDWWGKLYEEHGRGLLSEKSGEAFVKSGDWNRYEIVAQGHKIRTFINGKPCVEIEDAKGATRGVFALQLHSGGKTEVRFRNLNLEILSNKNAD